ncbi:MAG: hypothetical protein IJF39_00885 [Clostridia bacterium]|nr:hypothetical protein [Clostridia bacterium]
MKGHTVQFQSKPRIVATGTIAGPKECAGVVGKFVDKALSDDTFGEDTYEKAECKMLTYAVRKAIENGGYTEEDIDLLVSGDLLNQIISASFTARDFDFPFLGVYSACATMAESMAVAAALVDGGYIRKAVAATGSHFSSAERQYRYPLELGNTRPPQAQWTVTGAGAALLVDGRDELAEKSPVSITGATFGRVVDYGITDVNNMGAAMAPFMGIIEP